MIGILILTVGTLVPPLLAKNGFFGAARVGYWLYRPLCHEKGYRSFFLFGEAPVYPLALAGTPNRMNYEAVLESGEPLYRAAGEYIGNDRFGYKVALCQRDLAILAAIILFCAVFLISGRRIPPVPIWVWIVIGCLPMALDGGTQMIPASLASFGSRWRESVWQLRILTGALFGFFTAWLALPNLEKKAAEWR